MSTSSKPSYHDSVTAARHALENAASPTLTLFGSNKLQLPTPSPRHQQQVPSDVRRVASQGINSQASSRMQVTALDGGDVEE